MAHPPYAMMGTIGRVKVLYYAGDGKFWVLDKHDQKRLAARDELKFMKGRKKKNA